MSALSAHRGSMGSLEQPLEMGVPDPSWCAIYYRHARMNVGAAYREDFFIAPNNTFFSGCTSLSPSPCLNPRAILARTRSIRSIIPCVPTKPTLAGNDVSTKTLMSHTLSRPPYRSLAIPIPAGAFHTCRRKWGRGPHPPSSARRWRISGCFVLACVRRGGKTTET